MTQPPWKKGDPLTEEEVEFNMNDVIYGDLAVVHIITGPVGVEGAEVGDKIAVEILDIKPIGDEMQGFTMADTPLGFYNGDNAPAPYRDMVWWTLDTEAGGWVAPGKV